MSRATVAYESEALGRWRRATDLPLTVLAIGSLPILLLELDRSDLAHADRILMDVVNVVVFVAFAIDYVVELRLASRRRDYVRSEWTSLVIVVSQGLALAPSLGGFGAFRALRGVRPVAALARVFAIGGLASREGRQLVRRHAASFTLGLAGLTWLSSAVAFTLVEDVGPDGRLHSFFDGLWWATTTITTVGYGDVFPVTTAGRIVGAFTMLVGISTFAIVTAKVAEFLVRPVASESDTDAG